jgi:hypothetical protein
MLSNSGLPRASAPSKRGRHDRCRSAAALSLREPRAARCSSLATDRRHPGLNDPHRPRGRRVRGSCGSAAAEPVVRRGELRNPHRAIDPAKGTQTELRIASPEFSGRPPLHTRFKKGQSGNPGGRSARSLPTLLADALDETVVVTIDGRRRKITKRKAIVAQMVDKSVSADLRATKMLIDMMKDVEHKAGDAAPRPEPRRLAAPDKEVVQLFVARLRRQILQEIEEVKAAEPPGNPSPPPP